MAILATLKIHFILVISVTLTMAVINVIEHLVNSHRRKIKEQQNSIL